MKLIHVYTIDGMMMVNYVHGVVIGKPDVIDRESAKMMSLFDCDDGIPLNEYIGNKIDIGKDCMKLTQPVMLQSFIDEFGVDN